MKAIRTTKEALALCDYRRAKRTEPTAQQTEQARKQWRSSVLSRWMAQRAR